MSVEPGIEKIAPELYALGYEITAWIKYTDPNESYQRYRMPLQYQDEELELRITRDYKDNISFEMEPLIRVRGLNLSEPTPNQPVPVRKRWLILTRPKTNDKMPGITDPSYPAETFPASFILSFLQGLKEQATQHHQ